MMVIPLIIHPPREDMLIHSTDFKPTIKVVQSEIIQQAIISL